MSDISAKSKWKIRQRLQSLVQLLSTQDITPLRILVTTDIHYLETTPKKENRRNNIIKGPVELKMIGRKGAIEGKIKRYDRLFRMFSKASKWSKMNKKQVMRDLKKIIHNMSNTSKVKTHSFRNFDFLPKYDVESRLFNGKLRTKFCIETVCSKVRRSNKFDKSNEMWRKRMSASLVCSTKPSIDEVKRSYASKYLFKQPADSFVSQNLHCAFSLIILKLIILLFSQFIRY